jgi:hypothetical protein
MTYIMARPKRIGKKYDSFNDKIIDYQIRKTLWTERNSAKKGPDKFQGDYNPLSQLKSEIKNKIEDHLDGALLYSRIIQYGSLPRTPYNDKPFGDLKNNEEIKNFTLLNKHEKVRKEIEKETQEFISKIFTANRINEILKAIFFGYNKPGLEKEQEKYLITISEMLMAHAIQFLQQGTEPFLSRQLETAMEIVKFIKKNKVS